MSYISDLASQSGPIPSLELDRQKIAVVFNTNAAATESETLADYYISARSLNPDLKHGIDFGTTNQFISGQHNATGTFYLNIVIPFADWCRENDVESVIVSNEVPEAVSGLMAGPNGVDRTYKAGVLACLAACHTLVTDGEMLFSKFGHFISNPPFLIEHFIRKHFLTARKGDYRLPLEELWYEDHVFPHLDDTGIYQRTYLPREIDPNRGARPSAEVYTDRTNIMPNGRIGLYPTPTVKEAGWNDTFAECKVLIDDAIIAERAGWIVHRNLQHNGLHYAYTIQLNMHESAVPFEGMRAAGWNVKGCVRDDWEVAGLSPYKAFPDTWDRFTTCAEVMEEYSILGDSYDHDTMYLGNLNERSFATAGCSLTNASNGNWANSFTFERGAYHMLSTSFPSNTLASALAHGACSGISGTLEPLSGNTGFIPFTMIGLIAGKSMMESHFDFYQSRMTTHTHAAGDPLYTPYIRTLERNMTILDTLTITPAAFGPNIAGYIDGSGGTCSPETLQGSRVSALASNTGTPDGLEITVAGIAIDSGFFDQVIITNTTNPTQAVILKLVDADVEAITDTRWQWTNRADAQLVAGDVYQVDFASIDNTNLQTPGFMSAPLFA